MINYETKTIHLGHGDVVVGLHGSVGISIQNTGRPQKCGAYVGEEARKELFGDILCIKFSMHALEDLQRLLNRVTSGEIYEFEFAGYTFSFEPNSEASVAVFREKANEIMQLMKIRDRFIPARYLLNRLEERGSDGYLDAQDLMNAPTVSDIPIRRGRWLPPVCGKLGCLCSACKMQADNDFDFCPNCGAKMDERK